MAERLIRIGKVSACNYKKGLIKVTYPDLDDSVTDELPVFSFTDEYKMPAIGNEVLVLHLSNGCSAGIVMGRYWNEDNLPPAFGKKMFRKELGQAFGESYIQYDGTDMTLKDKNHTTTLGSILSRLSSLERKI